MFVRPVAVSSDAGTLPGELVVPEGARAVVVLCHGLPVSRERDPADPGYPGLARDLAARGFAALSFVFRGCFDAPGDFSHGGWCADLDAALGVVAARDETASLPRFVVGSSAGGGTAINVAARRDDVVGVATLAAVSSWTLDGLAPDRDAMLQRLRNTGLIRDPAFPRDPEAWWAEFDSLSAGGSISGLSPRPVLLVHGDADDVVGYEHAEVLFSLAGEPKQLVRIPGGGHRLRRDPRALEALLDWLEREA